MLRTRIIIFALSLSLSVSATAQFADLGTGNLKNQIWWFNWSGLNLINGASRTFTTTDGTTVTVTFTNVQGTPLAPSVMNTWYGAVLHLLYDFSDPQTMPALYTPYTNMNSQFTVNVTATRNGMPTPFKFIAADAEASAITEITTLTTNGSNWQCVDFFRNSGQASNPFIGCTTPTAQITDTWGGGIGIGQNPVIATDAPAGTLTVNCNFERNGIDGQMGIAFGIFGTVDLGDLPPNYGYAQHQQSYQTSNPCNYLPPLPVTTPVNKLWIGTNPGDADPVQTSDDNQSGADEDGVTVFPAYNGSGTYSLTIPVNNNLNANAFLTGWMDVNRNGAFDPNESATATVVPNATTVLLSWTNLPSQLPAGQAGLWAFRFLISSDPVTANLATGISPDGEVEDYLTSTLQTFSPHFDIPDTVCVGEPVIASNVSQPGTSFSWNFCTINPGLPPNAANIGSPGGAGLMPSAMDLVQQNGNFYGFVTNVYQSYLSRLNFGPSLLNIPTRVDLPNILATINFCTSIRFFNDNGNWYAVLGGTGISTQQDMYIDLLSFGPDVTNPNPALTSWVYPGPNIVTDLYPFQQGGSWHIIASTGHGDFYRLDLNPGANIAVQPSLNFITHINANPSAMAVNQEKGFWYVYSVNRSNNSVCRLDFGLSLLNKANVAYLGNPGGLLASPSGALLIKSCSETNLFVPNQADNHLIKLNFADALAAPTAVNLGNSGNINTPFSITRLVTNGNSSFSFISNGLSNTLTRLSFDGCNTVSPAGFNGQVPPSFSYSSPGDYMVQLMVDEGLPSQSSLCKPILVLPAPEIDFSYQLNSCDPLTVQFTGAGNGNQGIQWSFGDGGQATGVLSATHTFPAPNNYTVTYIASNGRCNDTITKTLNIGVVNDDIIRTHDTTICFGSTKQLLTQPALSFCWTPTTYLDNPNSDHPVTSTPADITYHYTAQVNGNNLIVNGDFSQGNTGFSSAYAFANPNTNEGEYFVGPSPASWNASLSACTDHSTGTGNMMLVNGAPIPDVEVWKQTVNVTPNTNYAFSTWLQALWPPNPAQLRFSINGKDMGSPITASLPTCTWTQFYTTWNSGNNTTATISIVNKNTAVQGNDFALDDISFAPVFIKHDSVRIHVDSVLVRTSNDAGICPGQSTQLATTGANTYQWSPVTGLSNPGIPNPIASPATTTQYIVTGTNANGCSAKDTVNITVNPLPVITKSPDALICKNSSTQLSASGGTQYAWTPAASLNNPNIPNPIASPATNTTYFVTVTNGATGCTSTDSVHVTLRPDAVFSLQGSQTPVCAPNPVQLTASGGTSYSWQPTAYLSNPAIANPIATPPVTTTYSVTISEATCNTSKTLSTTVNILPPPTLQVAKSNDIDCSNGQSQLQASGASGYSWSPVTGLNDVNIANPIAAPSVTTQYTVQGTDPNGCRATGTVTVQVIAINQSRYDMPNAFTPNGDGVNDCYGVRYWGAISSIEFSVYNRWGQRIFHSTDPSGCWDGTFRGKGQPLGVYVYVIRAKTLCGDSFKKGLFSLIR